MFAYCNNNPINYFDKTGRAPESLAGWAGAAIGEWLYELFTGRTHPNKQAQELENKIIAKQNETIVSVGKVISDAYNSSVAREAEAQHQNSMALISGFNYLTNHPEETVDLIGAEIGMSIAVYDTAALIIAGSPTAMTVVGLVGGVIWAGWGLYRAVKGIMSDF